MPSAQTQTTQFSQVSISLSAPVGNYMPVTIGNTTYNIPIPLLQTVWSDREESILRVYLICQMALVLQNAGVNPLTATNAQIASAIEAQQYWI